MREFIADDAAINLPDADNWRLELKSIMMEDFKSISVTRISMPVVMVISAVMLLVGIMSTIIWTAATKSTSLDQVINAQTSMQFDIKNMQNVEQQTKQDVGELKTNVNDMSKQIDTLTVQQENLTQQLIFQHQIKSK